MLSAPDEYVAQYQLLLTEQWEARIVGDTCLSCVICEKMTHVSVVKVRSWTRLPVDPRSGRTGCGRERTWLMEDGVDGRRC